MKTKIIRCISFILILFILLIILSYIVVPKNNSKEFGMQFTQANGILGEKDNTIDVLVVGDSEAYASITPMELWNDYGFTTYVSATPAQYLSESLSYIHSAMKNQKPKIVILEANCIYRNNPISSCILEVVGKMLPVIEYHNRWKNLNSNDFFGKVDYTWTDDMKGYKYKKGIKPVSKEKIKSYKKHSEKCREIAKLNKQYVKIIKQYCEANGAELILVNVPSTKNWNYQKHNGIKMLAEQEDIEYLDMNLIDNLKMDWNKDTRDAGDHLNHQGALKVTKYLGEYLSEKNILENHKQDEKYNKWDEAWIRYKRIVN